MNICKTARNAINCWPNAVNWSQLIKDKCYHCFFFCSLLLKSYKICTNNGEHKKVRHTKTKALLNDHIETNDFQSESFVLCVKLTSIVDYYYIGCVFACIVYFVVRYTITHSHLNRFVVFFSHSLVVVKTKNNRKEEERNTHSLIKFFQFKRNIPTVAVFPISFVFVKHFMNNSVVDSVAVVFARATHSLLYSSDTQLCIMRHLFFVRYTHHQFDWCFQCLN